MQRSLEKGCFYNVKVGARVSELSETHILLDIFYKKRDMNLRDSLRITDFRNIPD